MYNNEYMYRGGGVHVKNHGQGPLWCAPWAAGTAKTITKRLYILVFRVLNQLTTTLLTAAGSECRNWYE